MVIYEGRRYEVQDADELADALETGEITLAEAASALRSLHTGTGILAGNGCSGAALLTRYAPGLPHR
jgi:predicted RNA-binding protein associated with RNAse of E/G family